jgi:hypothetical protein
MASNLNGVVLSAPTEDPQIGIAGSFTMMIYGTYIGGGGASTHSLWLEWDQGTDTWQAIPASGGDVGLYTDGTSSYVDTSTVYDIGNPISITVYGDAEGTFKIRAHGDRGGTPYYDPADPWFTVTVASNISNVEVVTDLDALLQKTLSEEFSLDVLLQKNIPVTLSMDAFFYLLGTVKTSLDSQLWDNYTKDLTIDGLLEKIGIETSVSIDSILAKQFESPTYIDGLLSKQIDSYTDIDAILYVIGSETETLSIDSLLNKVGLVTTLNTDALLSKANSEYTLIDALIIKPMLNSLKFDSLLFGNQLRYNYIDAILTKLNSVEIKFDAILYDSGLLGEALALDALLLKIYQTKVINLDGLIYKNEIRTTVIDSILKHELSHLINIDALIKGQVTSGSLLDAIIYSALMQTEPFVEFMSRYLSQVFITDEEKAAFVFKLN